MAKKSAKLSVKKETLRTLSGGQLRQVAGGTLLVKVVYDPYKIDSSLECQGGILGGDGRTLFTCLRCTL